jgi:hypothetical protein
MGLTPEERAVNALRWGWVEFIRSRPWSHWFTGTQALPVAATDMLDERDRREARGKPVPMALRVSAMKWFLREIAVTTGKHVPYVWTADPQEQSAIHVLFAAPGMAPAAGKSLWEAGIRGRAKCDEYDPARVVAPRWGAVGYMVRHGGKPDPNVACNRERRCRRKYGCLEAPGRW